MIARSCAQASPAGPAPITATLRPPPLAAWRRISTSPWPGVMLPPPMSPDRISLTLADESDSGPYNSHTKRFSARIVTGASILPLRQASSQGAPQVRPHIDAIGLGERAT